MSFVARQPILRVSHELFGYELLFRSGPVNAFPEICPETATSKLIVDSVLVMGLERLVRGYAFVNVTRDVLVNGCLDTLPKSVVFEVLEDVQVDSELIESCRRLRSLGYKIALDDFELSEANRPLLDVADFVKLDFMLSSRETCARIAAEARNRGITLLAEKVETREDVDDAIAMGCELMQGYYFAKPEIISSTDVPSFKASAIRLLHEIHQPRLDLRRLTDIVRQDPSLTYRLLRYINSAHFGFVEVVGSIDHAIVLLGRNEVRRWATLIASATIAQDRPPELVRQALVRAQFCEGLAAPFGLAAHGQNLFLLGLMSLFDTMLGCPMEEVLEQIPVGKDLKDALSGEDGQLLKVLDFVRAYERGEWARPDDLRSSLDEELVAEEYMSAVEWADSRLELLT